MSDKDTPTVDNRPVYVSPHVIRLDDISTGTGASCGAGGSPTSGTCIPTGNGATVQSCGRGNGAKASCLQGSGF